MERRRKLTPLLFIGIALLLAFTPLISKVNFRQNDDWNRVTSVERFMHGDFSLLPVTATTFYTQGILGAGFALVFGIDKLPFLTLLVSVLNLLVFSAILYRFFKFGRLTSLLFGALLFFNPLHIYSMIGFMTENYTLFFVLLSLYFFLLFEESGKLPHLCLSNLLGVLAFLSKQNGIVLYAATLPYFLLKKKYKEFFYQAFSLGAVLIGFYLFFPSTPEMQSKGFTLKHLLDLQYSFSLICGICLVLVSFVLPLVLVGVRKILSGKFILIALISAGLFFAFTSLFMPGKISWEEYPYFENTFERTGFLPRTVQGTKYQFAGNYDLYKYWELASKIFIAVLTATFLFTRKRLFNLFGVYIFGYLVLMVFTQVFFDRYILALIPFGILFLINVFEIKNSKLLNSAVVPFVIFIAFLSTQMAYDFVFTHNYIWAKSAGFALESVPTNDMYATGAWKRLHGLSQLPKYLFTYDSFQKNKELEENYILIETYKPNYRPNLYINPTIYLYQRR